MPTLTFMHLSDLCIKGYPAADLDALLDDISVRMHGQSVDFIVVSGDLASSGLGEEYVSVANFLDDLLMKTDLTKDRLFVVPGNHDMDRSLTVPTYLQRISHSQQAVSDLLQDSAVAEKLLVRFAKFLRFRTEYFGHPDSTGAQDTTALLTTQSGVVVGLSLLNSALFAQQDATKGSLVLSPEDVTQALAKTANAEVRIAVLHHPLDWLIEAQRRSVKHTLLQRCHFVLHGHAHGPSAQKAVRGEEALVLACGTNTFQDKCSLAYNIIELETDTGHVKVTQCHSVGTNDPPAKGVKTWHAKISMRKDTQPGLVPASASHGESVEKTALIVRHNLPQPICPRFVGRNEELTRLRQLLSAGDRRWLVVVQGMGGVGKSALALEIAHRYLRDHDSLPADERFDAIVWCSAKGSELTSGGISPREHSDQTLNDIYSTIAITLDRPDILHAKPRDQYDLLRKALTQQRTLVVLDNLESVTDNRVSLFLRDLPSPTEAIVTTRHRIDFGHSIELSVLNEEEALSLIDCLASEYGLSMDDAGKQRLVALTNGIPLAIVWSLSLLRLGFTLRQLEDALSGTRQSDLQSFCVQQAVAVISRPSRQVLFALAVFGRDASREAIAYAANVTQSEADEAISELQRLALVRCESDRLSILPLLAGYISGPLASDWGLDRNLVWGRWVGWYRALTDKLALHDEDRVKPSMHRERELAGILHVIKVCLAEDDRRGADILLSLVSGSDRAALRHLISRLDLAEISQQIGDHPIASELQEWLPASLQTPVPTTQPDDY